MNRYAHLIVLVCCAALTLPAVAGNYASYGKKKQDQSLNIVETAAAAGQFETLIAAAKAAGLAGVLSGDGPLTIFAPTDEAFGALPAGTIESLLKPENKQKLSEILQYHVIAGSVGSDALSDGGVLETVSGGSARVTESEKGFMIEGARIVATDIDASNGLVHVIDRVIMPAPRMSRSDVMTLIDMAIGSGAPMYNHGNPRGTVDIYSTAARSMLTASSDLSSEDKARLMQGLSESRDLMDPREQAWRLRYALDDVSQSLMGMTKAAGAVIR
ncbi:MAG: fasciclin domain-containing protein [Pseudomonadales bacterium]|nr:fasciclin domain-containing protein [Pseudomonadales bacterium]